MIDIREAKSSHRQLIYLCLSAEGMNAERRTLLDRKIWRAIKALASGQQRGLGEWIVEMGPRLPQAAQEVLLLLRLQAVTSACLSRDSTSADTLSLGEVDFVDVPQRVLELARRESLLRVGDLADEGEFKIRVPAFEPVTVELLLPGASGGAQTFIVPTRSYVEIPVPAEGPLHLRAIDGKVYELKPDATQRGRSRGTGARDIAGIPYARAEFDKLGELRNTPHTPEATDLIVIAHSWNHSAADAEELYSRLFENFARVSANRPEFSDHPIAILGVLWPSKAFQQVGLQAGAAAGGAADENAMHHSVHQVAPLFSGSGAEEQIARLHALVPQLEGNQHAQEKFVDTLRNLVDPDGTQRAETTAADNSVHFFEARPSAVFENAKAPAFSAAAVPGNEWRGLGGMVASASTLLGRVFPGATNAAMRLLNYTTFFEMKRRAGTVGKEGVAPLINQLPLRVARIHLVGHGCGCRLVAAAAASSTTHKLCSLTLLQGAFSHHDFSRRYRGFFRSIVKRKRIAGPILVAYTKNDAALGIAYPIASRLAGDRAAASGEVSDQFDPMASRLAKGTAMLCNIKTTHDMASTVQDGRRKCRGEVDHTTANPRPTMFAQSDLDAFLTHNSKDKLTARELKRTLEARGRTVWFDEDQLRPGLIWQPLLEQGLQRAGSVIVALGGSGIGPWQNEETQLALNHAHALQRPVIPVLLPDCRDESALGGFVEGRTWVDLRDGYTDEQIARLIWGIAGEKPALIDSLHAGQNPAATKWILVAGSGGLRPRPSKIDEDSERLGGALTTAGFNPVTGGRNGVDHNVARAFVERIQQNGQALSGRLVQVMRKGATPDFPAGRLVSGASEDEAWRRSIDRADAVVLVGGLGGTYQTGELGLQVGKLVFPLADTRGPLGTHDDAYKFYFATLQDWSHNPASRFVSKDHFRDLSNPAPGVVADLIRLLKLTLVDSNASVSVP